MNNVLTKKYIPNLTIVEFLEESKMFIEEYSCPLCEGILYESVIDQCGHSFCKECLLNLLKETTKCPFTKNEISTSLSQNIIVNSVIEKQRVYCKNKAKGCTWIGKLSERKTHIINECLKETVDCIYVPNCPVKLNREELDGHIIVCPFRLVECPYCNTKIPFKETTDHEKLCPNIPVDCSNKCGMKIPLNKLNYHIETDCDNTVTECPFGLVGCDFYDIRKQLRIHLNVDLERHLKLISTKISSLELNIFEQNNHIIGLAQENEMVKGELVTIKESINSSHNELLEQLSMIQIQINTNKMYSTIPFANYIPNFFDTNSADVFQLNDKDFTIIKSKENYGWYGISSECLLQKNPSNNSISQSQMMKSSVALASMVEKETVIIINMKIISTKNSMIMFGITLCDKPSPLQGGYYTQSTEAEKSYMFYCYNSSVYHKGMPGPETKEQQCVDGDIISMILDTINNTLVFRRNGEVVNEAIIIPGLATMKIRAAIDLSHHGDTVLLLNR